MTGTRRTPAQERADEVVRMLLASHSDLESTVVGVGSWVIVVAGEIRLRIPVLIEVGERTCTLSSFLLRGPREQAGRAALHRALLRRNATLLRSRLCLDGDDDVVLQVRIPVERVTVDELDLALGEICTVGEESFEGLVHTAYPGVFPPLRRSSAPDSAAGGVDARRSSDHTQTR